MSTVVWVRRASKQRGAHVFVDGVAGCPWTRQEPGSRTPFQGRPVRPHVVLAGEELTTAGWPYGDVCSICERRARIALGLHVHRSVNRSTPNPPERP
jgi:hypothetical protein